MAAEGQGTIHVELHGPTVEGLATPILDKALQGAIHEVADYARFQVMITEEATFINPTGYYTSKTTLTPLSPTSYSLNDGGVIYGPWLEGVGSRNSPVTRFPGYHIYRKTKNSIAQKQKAIVQAWLERTVHEL
ncbi:hypothetical protein ABH931_006154 [Streptacidiphilus sp. MAP12-33]|uniref:hypothetical protein n=1 Tax=Streptacidiphilus sp. MAP12-33 TaxID=3156266 RepID=UPI003516CAED